MTAENYIEVPRWVREAFRLELKPHEWRRAMNNPIVGLREFVVYFAEMMEGRAVHLIGNTCQYVRVRIELAPPLLNHVMQGAFPHPTLPRQLAVPLVEGLYSASAFEFPCGIEGYNITLTAKPAYILLEDGRHIPVTRPEMTVETLVPMHIDLTAPPRFPLVTQQTFRTEAFGMAQRVLKLTDTTRDDLLLAFGARMAKTIEAGEVVRQV